MTSVQFGHSFAVPDFSQNIRSRRKEAGDETVGGSVGLNGNRSRMGDRGPGSGFGCVIGKL